MSATAKTTMAHAVINARDSGVDKLLTGALKSAVIDLNSDSWGIALLDQRLCPTIVLPVKISRQLVPSLHAINRCLAQAVSANPAAISYSVVASRRSWICEPRQFDVELARRLAAQRAVPGKALVLHDYVIIGGGQHASLRTRRWI